MAEIIVTSKTELEQIITNSISKVFKEQVQKEREKKVEILSLNEAAKYLHLAPQTLYGFTSRHTIPFIKKGKKLYFKIVDLELWLEQGRKKSKSEIEQELKDK